MRIFVYGISGQLHVCANSQDDADAVAAAYQTDVKLVVDESLEANEQILGCAIHVADKPKATVTAGRKAVKKLAAQRDWVDELEAAQKGGEDEAATKPPRRSRSKSTVPIETASSTIPS